MGFLCWLLGHKHDKDFVREDIMSLYETKNAVLHGKKIGTVEVGYKVLFCKRCTLMFGEKFVNEKFSKKFRKCVEDVA